MSAATYRAVDRGWGLDLGLRGWDRKAMGLGKNDLDPIQIASFKKDEHEPADFFRSYLTFKYDL